MFSHRKAASAARLFIACGLIAALSACGGGGDDAPAPAELPQSLSVSGPTTRHALGTGVTFGSNVTAPSGVKYLWEFGDGASSAVAAPTHNYAAAGTYTVRLTVTNEAGTSRMATFSVKVSDQAVVAGKQCSGDNSSGWCWQRPLPQGNAINDYFFLDDGTGWAVGQMGTILRTIDGGATWQRQASGVQSDLTSVTFTDANTGWVIGANGLVLRTSDAGSTWQAHSMGRNDFNGAITALDGLRASMASNWSGVLATTDGGVHWNLVTGPSGSGYVYSAQGSEVWTHAYGNTLAHSTDSGATWTNVTLPVTPGLWLSLSGLQFASPTHGWVIGQEYGYETTSPYAYVSRRFLRRTTDGGATWQPFAEPSGTETSSIRFIDANTGFAFLAYHGAQLQRTDDGGASWQPVPMPALSGAYAVSYKAHSPRTISVVDSLGRVHLTIDAGANWSQRTAVGAGAPSLSSVWFFNAREGVAIGGYNDIVRTVDGGQTWTATTLSGAYYWRRLQFSADGTVGWVISDSGSVYRSFDKGLTWHAPVGTSMPVFTDVFFADKTNGWAVSSWYGPGIYRTTDGGSSWQSITTAAYGVTSVHFADLSHGVAVGPSGVALVSSDGGQTWTARPTGIGQSLRKVAFVDSQTVVAVGDGGTILRSTDGGMNWSVVSSSTNAFLVNVRFLSATQGWAVGYDGTLLATNDGGLSWTRQHTGTRVLLQDVFFVNDQTGWVVGENGTILVTATGGQ